MLYGIAAALVLTTFSSKEAVPLPTIPRSKYCFYHPLTSHYVYICCVTFLDGASLNSFRQGKNLAELVKCQQSVMVQINGGN
mmetsp:Transcript_19486/g.36431  ORF Transcript_19486/g.36431 Transcript_19486/m.36431 type:complete len:82 (+) Transcript_19486:258-503(+)